MYLCMRNRCVLVHYNITGSGVRSGLSLYVSLQAGSVYVCVYFIWCMCLAGSVQDAGHGWSNWGRWYSVNRGGGPGALVAVGDGPPAAVLANERAVLIELDVHAVSIFSQRVITAQLTVCAQRRLAV